MPISSPAGIYKLRILDNSGKALLDTERTASKVNGIISFSVPFDTSSLLPGDYKLNIQDPGFTDWTEYVLSIK